jgi:hypothetical protein
MRTTYFSEILYSALQMCGLDRNLTTLDRFETVRDFASRRLQTLWESQDWPDLKRYTACTSVLANERRKVTLPNDVGQVIAIWNRDPLAHSAIEKDFTLYGEDVYLANDVDTDVWVEHRPDAPRLFGKPWSSATTYSTGSQVYYDVGAADTIQTGLVPKEGTPSMGDFYTYVGTTPQAGQIPPSGNWQKVSIPRLFTSYLIHGVHADYQRSQGNADLVETAEKDANQAVDQALDQVLRQQGQTRKINFRNY